MRWAPLILLLLISASEAIKPNILFIYLDDFGWRDTSYSGSDFYETPNIDKLAKGGMAFSNAYAAAANCAPSRASMITGTYSPRHQIYNVGTKPRGKTKFRKLEHISGKSSLSPGVKTWSKFAQESGYKTASIGKWHLGKDPKDHGFDINISGSQSGSPPKGYFPPHGKVPGLEQVGENEYLTDSLTNETIKFIRKNSNKPWLTYLSHFAVHTPLQAKTKDINKFKNKAAGSLHNHVIMAGMIKAVDDGVGKIISTLNELKIKENTIIIFYSDNGGYGGIGREGFNGPWRGSLFTSYEGSHRVPFLIRWPKKIPARQISNEIVHAMDVYGTLAAMLDLKLPDDRIMDSLDHSEFFMGRSKKSARESIVYYISNEIVGVKWRNWKMLFKELERIGEPVISGIDPAIYNLYKDPQERERLRHYIQDTWVEIPLYEALEKHQESIANDVGAPGP